MSKNSLSDCVFCSINEKQGPNRIRFQDEKYLVFEDINPSAATHFLVVPKNHIDTVNNLTSLDTQMVREMYEVGVTVLKKEGVKDMILGFHIPPFTSIPHLHLHAIGLPFKNFWRSMKYPRELKTPWFINAQEYIAKLERQRIPK